MADSDPIDGLARRILTRLAVVLARVGGAAMVAAMIMTVAAVVAATAGRPILGDSEIIAFLVAVSIFGFFPYCHIRGGNVVVDVFTSGAPAGARRFLDGLMNALFALVAMTITWRLIVGGVSAFERGRRSMFLEIPDAWGYAVGAICLTLWSAIAVLVAWEKIRAREE